MSEARTEIIRRPPKPTLFQTMRNEPGMLARVVAEWVGIMLLVSSGLAIIFLLVLGAYSLVHTAP